MNTIETTAKAFVVGDAITFEVVVDDRLTSFSWAIVDNRNQIVDFGHHRRAPGTPTEVAFTSDPVSVEGGYQALLLRSGTRPRRGHGLAKGPSSIIDSTSFAVAPGTNAPGHPQQPFTVTLAHKAPSAPVPKDITPTFAGFATHVAKLGPDYQRPYFGHDSYTPLLAAAKRYVSGFQVRDFTSLIPTGYIAGRQQAALGMLGLTQRSVNPALGAVPAVELIWNYWQQEGMLVQTLQVILARFQNRRIPGRDPLSRFDVSPLLPLRNRLWGFAETERDRLTTRRLAIEYGFQYGLVMLGRAIPRPHVMVERRSAFIESFHQVLHHAHVFYKELDDLTVQADAFPLYQSLRDCHLVLSQGYENQAGEMALQARAEFLVMQSILAEPEMREFLGGRPMTPYEEPWMDRVDSMKAIQGWTDTSVMHFHDLATIGERLVLTIRLGNWTGAGVGSDEARDWAIAFRSEIQRYAAAYRAATGVDLSKEANAVMPSTLLARKAQRAQLRA